MIERQDMPSATTGAESGVFFRSVLAAAVSGVLASPAAANPTGPQVAHGNAVFSPGGPGRLNVTNSPGTIINWQGFSIARGELTRFIQQNGASAVLNRVTGGDPSAILGSLLSNGRVFLINRNGIVFGESAIIDTAGFVASTLNISDTDFLAGRMAFSGDDGATLENRGFIRVRPGGDVMLIAPDVKNTGLIHAEDGSVLLAAGRDIVIESMDFEHVRFRVQSPDDQVLNLGRIVTTGGVVALFAGTLRHDGVIEANRVSRDSKGQVRLHAAAGASVGGRISATGQGTTGGDVAITGARVELTAAGIDVSGDAGGGRVRVGGDYQGRGELPRSNRTSLDGATRVSADARGAGDGGEIIIWSDGDTSTFADLSARGGPSGGDGGLVETSGKRNLAFGPPADVSAPAGRGGTWLLDPEDINIGSGEAASISTALNGGSNVSVKTSDDGDGEGNIAVNSAISKTEGPDAALSMDAHNRIDVNAPITSTAGKLDVSLKAGRAVHVKADVKTNGGNFSQVVTGLALEIEAPEDEAGGDETVAGTSQSEGQSSQAEETLADSGNDNSSSTSGESGSSASTSSQDPAPDAANSVVVDSSNSSAPPQLPESPEIDAPEVAVSEDTATSTDSAPDMPEAPETPDPIAFSESTPEAEADDSITTASSKGVDEDPAAAFKAGLEVLVEGDIDTDGGDVHIDAGREGDAGIFGKIDTSSDEDKGGDIRILGRNVGIYADAEVDASGKTGGGTVLVGGGRQGQDPNVPNARTVHVGERTTIRADATGAGDGGEIIVFADHTAHVLGRLSARGGPDGGDGGFVETSGKVNLQVAGTPDIRAPQGRGGTWLIDPINLAVVDGNVDINVTNTGGYTYVSDAVGAQIGTYQILYGLSYGGTVTLVADDTYGDGENGDINWAQDAHLDAGQMYSYGGGFTEGYLNLYADGDINFSGKIYSSMLAYGGIYDLQFIADHDGNSSGGINILGTSGGTLIDIEGNFTGRGAFFNATGGANPGDYVDISTGGEFDVDVVGDFTLAAGGGNDAHATVFSNGDMTVRGDNVSVLASDTADAELSMYSYFYNPSADTPPTATQIIEARDGDVTVRGGGLGDTATISAEQYVRIFQYGLGGPYDNAANLVQRVSASGNVNVEGGTGTVGIASIELYQDFETFSYDNNTDVDFSVTQHAEQHIAAGGNINVLGGDGSTAVAEILFDQYHDIELIEGSGSPSWTSTISGGQYVDASGDINVIAGSGANADAVIDPAVGFYVKYENVPAQITVNVTTQQQVRAGYNGDGALNITADGGDASVSTGGNSFYQYFFFKYITDVGFGTSQTVEADRLNIVSGSNGRTAQIALYDGSSLDGEGNPGFTQTIDIGGDALMRSSDGGIARILNDGLNGSVRIDGDFDFHEGVDGASLTQIQLSNLVEPSASGSLNVLGDTNISGSPSVTGNGGVVLVDATGEGTLDAQDVTVNGTLSPGNSPGILFFPGNLTLGPGSNTLMEIGGTPGSGLFDKLNVGGTANLAGTMTVVLINGFTPNGVLVYDLISAGTLSGSFSAFNGPGFGDGQNSTTYFVSTGVSGPVTPPAGPSSPNNPPGPNPPTPPPTPPDPFKPVLTFFDPQPDTDDELEERRRIGLCTASNTSWYMPIEASRA